MYGGIIHPFSLTVGAADKTQRDVEINQLAFFFFGIFRFVALPHRKYSKRRNSDNQIRKSYVFRTTKIAEKKR